MDSKIYNNQLIPLKLRNYSWHLLKKLNIDIAWFREFRRYWTQVLGGRPLWDVHDFYFLRNSYRIRFQNNQLPDKSNSSMHLQAWQKPELLYQLFHQVLKESLFNQLEILSLMKKYKNEPIKQVLELGCATAPITASLKEFFKTKNIKIYISDIQTLAFHYAAHRFRHQKNITPLLLKPENDFMLTDDLKIDVIFCVTVFEHLNKPLAVIKRLHNILNRDGLLFFDYIKGDGGGLDSVQGVLERDDVLNFVGAKFELIHGCVSNKNSMGLTVVRKK